jgi:hypothetical protein
MVALEDADRRWVTEKSRICEYYIARAPASSALAGRILTIADAVMSDTVSGRSRPVIVNREHFRA